MNFTVSPLCSNSSNSDTPQLEYLNLKREVSFSKESNYSTFYKINNTASQVNIRNFEESNTSSFVKFHCFCRKNFETKSLWDDQSEESISSKFIDNKDPYNIRFNTEKLKEVIQKWILLDSKLLLDLSGVELSD